MTVTEVARNFSDYINRIFYNHEHFILMRGKKPVAELKPILATKTLGDLPVLLASLPSLSKNESEKFSVDVMDIRNSHPKETLQDPWQCL
ncbi:MAG: hypothetical protein GKR87_04925 [Kiritimatiellae bacterium]|nr:hypothetical protein [Kiritimatiellia bacterium]